MRNYSKNVQKLKTTVKRKRQLYIVQYVVMRFVIDVRSTTACWRFVLDLLQALNIDQTGVGYSCIQALALI